MADALPRPTLLAIDAAGAMSAKRSRIDDDAGGWAEGENPRHRPRSPEEQRRYVAEPAP